MNSSLLFLLPTIPLLGFLVNILLGMRLGQGAGLLGCLTVAATFGLAIAFHFGLQSGTLAYYSNLATWFSTGDFTIPFELQIDRLTSLMTLIICGVGLLIHVYSLGYMAHDEGQHRFFAYLNLFVFFMLMLVMGASLPLLFVGWEGVGLCSYLLIGFWYKNQPYNSAAAKAFIMNRIGDLGLLLGMFLLAMFTHSLSYREIFTADAISAIPPGMQMAIALLLFVGAIGKSAQIPLFTWLPDAMAGPTPVSALIHAATMVTAGIYLIVRANVLFTMAPMVLPIVGTIGIATSLIAGIIAIGQYDIKKVLAYSTVSQLGLMFMALGLGAYNAAMFHLVTHAFFKALLFLGAGSVIHGLHEEQDLRQMGGLRRYMPITCITFLIGTIAITGIPPLAGFFSKDEILAAAFEAHPALWVIGLVISLLTAIYMYRLLALAFFGEHRGHHPEKIHESPVSITFPLIALAVLSVFGGLIGIPHIFGGPHLLAEWLSPITGAAHAEAHMAPATEIGLMAGSTLAILIAAYIVFRSITRTPKEQIATQIPKGFRLAMYDKLYFDEMYDTLIVNPIKMLSGILGRYVDRGVLYRIVTGFGDITVGAGRVVRFAQTGNVGFYLLLMVIGILAIFTFNLFFNP